MMRSGATKREVEKSGNTKEAGIRFIQKLAPEQRR